MRTSMALASFALLLACGGDNDATPPTGPATGTGSGGSGGSGGQAMGGAASGGGGSGGAPVPMIHYLYVSNGDDDTVSRFSLDEASGTLSPLGTTPAAGGPGSMALSPDGRVLYVALRSAQSVAAFSIDAADGSLTEIDTDGVGVDPVYLSVDATGAYLLLSSYGANRARVFPVQPDGSISAPPTDDEMTGTNPHAIITDPSNSYAFVPNTNNAPDQIQQYSFDAESGTLTSNGAALATAGSGPRHLVFHPSMPWLYVVNEHEDSVTLYDFDASAGTLAARATVPTIPGSFEGANNTCADIHITGDGRFVYASNRGHDSIAMFAVDAGDGTLTPLGQEPTEARPREFEVALDRYLYAAGQDSNMLAAYAILPDGDLSPIDTYAVGDGPLWVTAVSLPPP